MGCIERGPTTHAGRDVSIRVLGKFTLTFELAEGASIAWHATGGSMQGWMSIPSVRWPNNLEHVREVEFEFGEY